MRSIGEEEEKELDMKRQGGTPPDTLYMRFSTKPLIFRFPRFVINRHRPKFIWTQLDRATTNQRKAQRQRCFEGNPTGREWRGGDLHYCLTTASVHCVC